MCMDDDSNTIFQPKNNHNLKNKLQQSKHFYVYDHKYF